MKTGLFMTMILKNCRMLNVENGVFTEGSLTISDGEIQGIVNALDAPDTAQSSGSIFKFTASWRPNNDSLFYATASEGFRPGLLNRPGGAVGPNSFTVPFEMPSSRAITLLLWPSAR